MPEVRLVGEDGKQIGVLKTPDALAYAQQRDLDLVEVAPEARPPVCRALDYSKYKYEQAQKQKAARKHQQQITIREIKFRPKIAQNDYDTKKGHVQRFLLNKDKVKVTIMFRGREVTHPERGVALLDKLAGELSEVAVVDQSPIQDGRNMTMMLSPSKAILATEDEHAEPTESTKRPRREQRIAEAEAEAEQSDNGKPKAKRAAKAKPPAEVEPPAEAEVAAEAEQTAGAEQATEAEQTAGAEQATEAEVPVAEQNGTTAAAEGSEPSAPEPTPATTE